MKIRLLFCTLILCYPAFAQEPVYQSFDVDSVAQPRGGLPYLNAFLQTNLRKPTVAESKGIGGRVIVSGIVETDGRVSDVKAIQSKFPELNHEAVRVFRLFNAWQPAQKAGIAVRQHITFPVTFKPNEPFTYADGARISYFDADKKPVAEGNEQIRYKQVSPMDTSGLPTGDIIVYRAKGTNWKEDYRILFVRRKREERGGPGQPTYLIGYQDADKLWQGNVFGVDDTGALVSRATYENDRRTGSDITYHANGSVAEQVETVDSKRNITSWYPNGQIKRVWTADGTESIFGGSPRQVTAFWDSTGHQFVQAGNGKTIYAETRQSRGDTTQRTRCVEQGRYANGFKQGIWTGRYDDGSFFYEEEYDNKGVCQGGRSISAGSDTVRYAVPQEQPEFRGGMQSLVKFLGQNLRYPADAQRARVQGRVFLSFVVCTDGTLCDYKVLKGLDRSTDEEALRVVKAMSGRWKPGSIRGQKVRVQYNIPINFTLQ